MLCVVYRGEGMWGGGGIRPRQTVGGLSIHHSLTLTGIHVAEGGGRGAPLEKFKEKFSKFHEHILMY